MLERRGHPRVPLDIPYFARMRVEGGKAYAVMIVDINRWGIQAAFATPDDAMGECLGMAVLIEDLPARLDPSGTGWVGNLSWVTPLRCGVRFVRILPLSDAELSALNDML